MTPIGRKSVINFKDQEKTMTPKGSRPSLIRTNALHQGRLPIQTYIQIVSKEEILESCKKGNWPAKPRLKIPCEDMNPFSLLDGQLYITDRQCIHQILLDNGN